MGVLPGTIRNGHRLAVVGLLAGVLVTSGCGTSSLDQSGEGQAAGDVKIGLLVPLSGVYAPLGQDMRNGFQLYLDQHGGKFAGRTVNLVTADEGDGPQTGVPAAQKLVTQDQVTAVAGIVNSAVALGVRDLFHESKVPLVIANAGADAITGARKSDYVWRTSFSNGKVSAALGAAVAQEVKGGKVYLIAADYAAGKEMVAGFKSIFQAAGGTVAGEKYTPFGKTQDFQPYLSEILSSGATAVYSFYAGAEAVSFVQQYQQFGLKRIPLYGPGFLTEGGVLKAQGQAAVGVKTSLHYSTELDSPRNKEFVEAYRKAFNAPPTVYAVQAYDAAAVLDKALANASGSGGEAIVKALTAIGPVDSPRGQWSFDPNHDPDQPYYLREVRAGGGGVVNAVIRELS